MPGLEWVSPTITAGLLLAGVIITALVNRNINKKNAQSSHEPSVTAAWKEADEARAGRRVWEDLYYLIRAAFKGYARRMQEMHGDAAALTSQERLALETKTPNEESDKEKETT